MTDISVDEAKQAIRERVWSLLEVRQAVAPSVHGRIPAFHGADWSVPDFIDTGLGCQIG
jgi:5-formyltetrahydrofolate cyclo-ligase